MKKRMMDAGVKESQIGIDDRGVLKNPIFLGATALINARPMRHASLGRSRVSDQELHQCSSPSPPITMAIPALTLLHMEQTDCKRQDTAQCPGHADPAVSWRRPQALAPSMYGSIMACLSGLILWQ